MLQKNTLRLKEMFQSKQISSGKRNRDSESVVFNIGQKMAQRAAYVVIC